MTILPSVLIRRSHFYFKVCKNSDVQFMIWGPSPQIFDSQRFRHFLFMKANVFVKERIYFA